MTRMIRVGFFAFVISICALGSAARATNYIVDKNLAIHTGDGATLCALVVRPAGSSPLPTALEFPIYVDPEGDLTRLESAADRGYAGVMAYVATQTDSR